jgi:alpha-beta hydrolase superfamily lysophospholipase
VVILLHGVRADRRSQVERLRLLKKSGYTVLAFDFQAHGESPGKHITFGRLEGMDARAAVDYVQQKFPGERIGMVGQSLGGAAVLLAPQPLPVDAIVVEAVFPDIDAALRNRLALFIGPLARLLTPFYTALMPWVIGVNASDLRPIDQIGKIKIPVLVLAGAADTRTTLEESKDLFAHAHRPKAFHAFSRAGHVDLLNYAPEEYAGQVLPFLARHLRKPGGN